MKKLLTIIILFPLYSYSQFITGGYPITANQAPFQASLQLDNSHQCGCSVLNDQWLITAAHCITSSTISNYKIKTGITDLSSPSSNSATYDVSQIIVHPNFNSPTGLNNDIALIRIAGKINFNADTQPIQLATPSDNLTLVGQNTKVSGWGWTTTGTGSSTNQLMMVNVPIISNSNASSQLDISSPGHSPVTSNMVATGSVGANRQGACHGDSGGPLVALTSSGDLKQIGTVSWGVSTCVGNPNSPSIYAKVENYTPWINQYITPPINISGISNVCGSTTFNLLNNINNNAVSWSWSPNLTALNSSNSSITVTPISSSTNGQGTITATVNGQNYTKTIWIGKPTFTVVKSKYNPPTIINVNLSGLNGVDINSQGITDVTWEKISNNPANCGDITSTNGFYGEISYNGYSCSTQMKITATNSCGSTIIYKTIVGSYNPGDPMRIVSQNTYKIFPNPSSNIINISLFDQTMTPSPQTPVTSILYDLNGQEKRSVAVVNNTASINVSHLKKGIYVLKINIDGVTESHQVIVE